MHLKRSGANKSAGALVKRQTPIQQVGVEYGAVLFLISSWEMLLVSGPHNQCRGTKPREPGTDKRHLPGFLPPPQEAGTIRPI